MIQAYRPVQEILDQATEIGVLSTMTDARLAGNHIEYDISLDGQPSRIIEDLPAALRAICVIDATLTSVTLMEDYVYYMLSGSAPQVYVSGGTLARELFDRDGIIRRVTGVRRTQGGVDYEVLDGNQAGVAYEAEESVLTARRILGASITGAKFEHGNVFYALA